jgi:hypothetical protein
MKCSSDHAKFQVCAPTPERTVRFAREPTAVRLQHNRIRVAAPNTNTKKRPTVLSRAAKKRPLRVFGTNLVWCRLQLRHRTKVFRMEVKSDIRAPLSHHLLESCYPDQWLFSKWISVNKSPSRLRPNAKVKASEEDDI